MAATPRAATPVFDGDILNVHKEGLESVAENVADVDGESTDNIAEIDEDSGYDDAWEGFFDTVVIDTEASNLRKDDYEKENDEDAVGDILEVFPDDIGRR